ncbi:hypothetical protein SAMN05444161_4196 [Rhizobiales bacterium GAS191]|nr:hypothetical protein SAMN05444161_4196 [Rhizobiales bacterium GAS191]
MARKPLVVTLSVGVGAALAILVGAPAEAGSNRCEAAIRTEGAPNIFAITEQLARVREAEMQIWINAVTDPNYGWAQIPTSALRRGASCCYPCR